MRILVINSGSSSLKFAFYDLSDGSESLLTGGEFPGIGEEESGHREAAQEAIARALQIGHIDAVAHRVVHGGPGRWQTTLVDPSVLDDIEAAVELAPLHNPAAMAALETAIDELPVVPQVAVFDTGFHETLPPRAYTYGIDQDIARRHGIRRYGFHGIAHQYMAEQYAKLGGSGRRLVTLQLGSGCSASAVLDGRSVDTSMGLTPLEGLLMETRSGDIDPSVFALLSRLHGMSPLEVEELLNQHSGLLGLAGVRDMRQLVAAEAGGDERAALAIEIFVYRIQKYIGAYAAAMQGLDAVLFGGGIGQNSAEVRARVCAGLGWLGLNLDPAANQTRGEGRISAAGSAVEAWVIEVNEALMMAREASRLLSNVQAMGVES